MLHGRDLELNRKINATRAGKKLNQSRGSWVANKERDGTAAFSSLTLRSPDVCIRCYTAQVEGREYSLKNQRKTGEVSSLIKGLRQTGIFPDEDKEKKGTGEKIKWDRNQAHQLCQLSGDSEVKKTPHN